MIPIGKPDKPASCYIKQVLDETRVLCGITLDGQEYNILLPKSMFVKANVELNYGIGFWLYLGESCETPTLLKISPEQQPDSVSPTKQELLDLINAL